MKARGLCWPNPEQILMLEFLFGPNEQAPESFRRWRAGVDLQTLDEASVQLLPLVYQRLLGLELHDPEMSRLRGTYRRTWLQNQLLLQKSLLALDALISADIPVMAVKGLAALRFYDHEVGLRSMMDIDLFVPITAGERAVDTLVGAGFRPSPWCHPDFIKRQLLRRDYSWAFVRDGGEVDLHWHALHRDPSHAVDSAIWQHAELDSIAGRRCLLPSVTDQLLWTCIHGAVWNSIGVMTWVADAAAILRRAPEQIDWERWLELTFTRRLTLTLLDAMSLLRQLLGPSVPEHVLQRLEAQPVTRSEELEYEAFHRPSQLTLEHQSALEYLSWCRNSQLRDLRGVKEPHDLGRVSP